MKHNWFPRPRAAGLGFVAVALLLTGCAKEASWDGIYSIDRVGGAKTCTVPEALPPDGKTVLARMTVSNEGGWCGIVTKHGAQAYDSYLMVVRPVHGRLYAHHVGEYTRIDYTPDVGFVGADRFSVQLIPGAAQIESIVNVTP